MEPVTFDEGLKYLKDAFRALPLGEAGGAFTALPEGVERLGDLLREALEECAAVEREGHSLGPVRVEKQAMPPPPPSATAEAEEPVTSVAPAAAQRIQRSDAGKDVWESWVSEADGSSVAPEPVPPQAPAAPERRRDPNDESIIEFDE
jgi:hypothetical protein